MTHIGLRPPIHLAFQQSPSKRIGDHMKSLNGVSPTNGWPNGAKEPIGGTIPLSYHSQPRRLGNGATNSHPGLQQHKE